MPFVDMPPTMPSATLSGVPARAKLCAKAAPVIMPSTNTPASLSVLEGLLNTGGYTPSRRASVAGLLQTRNQKAVDLAMPLLESPYEELAITAALAMARHGDARCRKNLLGILQSPDRHRMTIPILAAWYLLRLDGRSKDVANQLAGLIK